MLAENGETELKTGAKVKTILKRANIDIYKLNEKIHIFDKYTPEVLEQLNIIAKYEGYIEIQQEQINKTAKNETILIPDNINYKEMSGLRLEARQKLEKFRPNSIGQASRISGISPADISVLLIYLQIK